ncbi:hypothetical protein JCM3775_004809 [Rhodotorula graminis]|uniref:Polynucleotide 5'-hydroxyl-kinase GRC3 n=1 Tax=Rhodotorula graminis (strain WP1) TaxID=578459 RepID=A0A0P9EIQ3_RHOGW|nr:uncharacterized protein RHOBADRAFT_56555 [Rhodotorula graminis WP1]KPV71513.1 hypothetical protein RHOBADRAFT_56555 [Rhodotorula graminis WP1]
MPAPAAGAAAKKRPRTSAAPPAAASSSTPSAPPLSAVAARRAAREAAAAAASTLQTSTPAPAPPPADIAEDDGNSDGESVASSSSVEAVLPQAAQPRRKQQHKGKGPARYFAEPAPRRSGRVQHGEEMDVDSGEVSPPEGLDPASDVEPDVIELATPVRARRRREKSAFVDPYCLSAFHFLEGVNSVQTTVVDEGGVQREAVLYALQVGETLVLRGACTLTPVVGSVKVLGATLAAPSPSSDSDGVILPPLTASTSHPLFAPSSHPLPPIFGAPLASPLQHSLLLPSGATLDLTPYVAVVLVSDLVTGIDGIERVLVAGGMGQGGGMFGRRKGEIESAQGGATWSLVLEPEPSLAGLRPLDPWLAALAASVPPLSTADDDDDDDDDEPAADRFVALVEGPKRVGKSTFAKMLLNSLLARYGAVAYLDTDLGQPEFTPSGFLSLNVLRRPVLGPSFTHVALPLASRFLGSTSPASDPSAYLEAAQALLETYALEVEYPLDGEASTREDRKVVERVPLVINTQGWVKGLGADLLDKLKALARPTHVFSFATPDDAPAPPVLGALTTLLPPAPPSPLESKWSAADYRVLSLVSYFHALVVEGATPAWDFTRPLLAQSPFALTLADLPGGVRLATAAGESIPHTHVLHALNGALVALVAAAPSADAGAAPSPSSSSALGLALVHSIAPAAPDASSSSTTLHVHTPVPASVVASARASLGVIKGELDLPVALMLDWAAPDDAGEHGVAGVEWREVPFLSVDAAEAGGRKRVRRNVMRRGQA